MKQIKRSKHRKMYKTPPCLRFTSSRFAEMKLVLLVAALVSVNARVRLPHFGTGQSSALIETENSEYDVEGHKFYQGDMVLDRDQLDYLESPIDTRKAHSYLRYRWPNARVPYRLSEEAERVRADILRGIRHWEENCCVRFHEVAANYVGPHLIFQRHNSCSSLVGHRYYMPQGQSISIGPGCETLGTVAHEIGHALGFYHEQARPDRDDHVVVLDQNVEPNMMNNFKLEREIDNYDIPYDLTSLMHYTINGFSINGKNTLVTRDPFKHFMIGQRDSLSFYDKKLANIMYNCSANSNCDSRIRCENEGYVDENCRCVCPPGFSGQTCRQGRAVPDESLTCGGAINRPTTVSSPNYPGVHPKNSRCVWVVTGPVGRRVRAHFTAFHLLERWDENSSCEWDILELRTDNLHDGEQYCDRELMGKTITSRSNTMVFVFSTKSDFNEGFEAQIDFV